MLGNSQPKSINLDGDQAQIIGQQGEVITTSSKILNVLDRSKSDTDPKFNATFSSLEHDSNINSFALKFHNTEKEIFIKRDKFQIFASAEPIIDEPEQKMRLRTVREKLKVISLSFRTDLTWKFLRPTGTSITAKINAENFIERLKARAVSFTDGDEIDVTMEFSEKYDKFQTHGHRVAATTILLKCMASFRWINRAHCFSMLFKDNSCHTTREWERFKPSSYR